MSRGGLILTLGIFLGAAGFVGCYFLGTAPGRGLMQEAQPELAWLKKEFNLSDAEFDRISALHDAYLPQCGERCRLIEEQNLKLKQLLAKEVSVTSEIQTLLAERAKTRALCETEMLKHFHEVSQAMPPEQGRRYLAWVEERTVLRPQAMESSHKTDHSHHSMHAPQP